MNQTYKYEQISQMIHTASSLKRRSDTDFLDEFQEFIFRYKENQINPLFGQSSEHIIDNLLKHEPTEEGGLVAIYGFYYQMLVLIEYMIEAIRGKWSFLSLEYHDDIIAGNEDQKVVRFIQVKTSAKSAVSITDSNIHIYNRSTSKKEGPAKGKVRNNSWLDKVIDNAAYVKDLELTLEFDIVTDYSIYSSTKVNVDIYNEATRGKIIQENDVICERLKSTCFDQDGNEIDYDNKYGKSLPELLGNVCFVQKSKVDVYRKWLCTGLSETLGAGIRINENDINWLVGELLSKCSNRESGPILFLRKDEIEGFRQALRTKAVVAARPTVYKTDATELLNRCMTSILAKISDGNSKIELELEMEKYKHALLDKVTEYNTLQSLLKRFIDGEKPRFGDNEKDYSEDLIIFIKTSLLLYLIHDKFILSDKFETLLIKEAFSNTEEDLKIGFLNLGLELDMDEGVKLLENIINKSSEEEQLEMLWRSSSLYTIFHGDSIRTSDPLVIEINTSIKPKVEQLEMGLKSNDVSPVLTIVPERPLNDLYQQVRRTQNVEEFKLKIEEAWTAIKRT
ncbi:hypothetical protein SB775_17845 [Peribacillus sp. SIMBA_075]|uniref:hypothetical protein n=1 Tax=Peribacillus sp. SIMBA_075 TaxID=3085813 RepID=UPI00397BB256